MKPERGHRVLPAVHSSLWQPVLLQRPRAELSALLNMELSQGWVARKWVIHTTRQGNGVMHSPRNL